MTSSGGGAASLTSKDVSSSTDNVDASAGESSYIYTIQTIPMGGYMVRNKEIQITYVDKDGKEKTDEESFQMRVTNREKDSWISFTGSSANLQIKKDSMVDVRIYYIGKYQMDVYAGKTAGEETTKTEVTEFSKQEKNEDGTYTNTYEIKDGSTVTGTVKFLNVDAQKVETTEGADMRAAYEDRIAIVAKAASGYKLDKLLLVFTGDKEREQAIVTTDNSIVDPDGGTTYLFYMPEADAKIVAFFVKDESQQGGEGSGSGSGSGTGTNEAGKEDNKTASGKSVGVGAGFAMTYGSLDVKAGIGICT